MLLKSTRRELIEFVVKRGMGVAALAQIPFIKDLAGKIDTATKNSPSELKILTYISHENKNKPLMGYYEDFSNMVLSASKGALKINFLTIDQVDASTAEAKNPFLIEGIDGYHLASSYLNELIPGSSLFTEVSEFNEDPLNKNHIDPVLLNEWQKVLQPHGLTWNAFGFASGCGLWSKKPITCIQDLQGLRVRTHGVALQVLRDAGGSASYGQFTRRLDEFRADQYDAMEGYMPYFDYFMGLPSIAKNFYSGSWPRKNTQMGIFLKNKTLSAMPVASKNLLFGTFSAFNDLGLRKARVANMLGRSALKLSGVQMQSMPSDVESVLKEKKISALRGELSKTPQTSRLLELFEARTIV